MIATVVFVVATAVLLMVGVERVMARFGIRPVHPDETNTGFPQITARVGEWAERRRDAPTRRDRDPR